MKKKIVALYGPTSSREMYLYGLGVKIKPEVDYPCIPCLSPACAMGKTCMDFIEPEKVAEAVEYVMKTPSPLKEFYEV